MDKVSKKNKMINERVNILRSYFKKFDIDGYVIPKNDQFFSEYTQKDRLKFISNFSGSAGYAIILKKKKFLFVDGRYTIQAQKESGKNFKIVDYQKIVNCNLFKNLTLGIDPKIFTSIQIEKFFLKNNKIKIIEKNLIDEIWKYKFSSNKKFFSLKQSAVGENYKKKINKLRNYLLKRKLNYIFISAPENVAWLLNIRGNDNPNSPIPNCHLFFDNKKKLRLITKKTNAKRLIKEKKIALDQIIEPQSFQKFIDDKKSGEILIDSKSCSLHYENIFKKKFKIIKKEDPIYILKSIKNKVEIQNMIKSHIHDGVALTKFIYWMKIINKKKITEYDAQSKLEKFRKMNKNYLYPSFNTIAGCGSNGAIVHYRAVKKNSKIINQNDIFLCDSGGQYKYGTTDVTRTICFSKPKKDIKNIFTRVLKGHIAVARTNLNKDRTGKSIDTKARKFLKMMNLDYEHGTGHGVGFFLNVHEGPQAISKNNNVKISEGMILSNEPGFYKKGKFGIRIENLVYVKRLNKKLFFENLTLVPIDKDLIDYGQLSKKEKDYLFQYNMNIYSKLSPFLKSNEKKWLASFI